jgi:short-subunit dehydrogenase
MTPRRAAFDGRVAIVTGASAGIGAATARALAEAGAHVVLCARRVERLEQLAAELSAAHGVEAHALAADMSSRAQIEVLVGEVLHRYDRIDILINNAGVGLQGDAAVLPERELRYLFDVNVHGPLWAMQAVIPSMRRRQAGAIANITSILAKAPLPSLGMTGGSSGYAGSKAALHAISLAARMELAADGIGVVTVLPGVTRSEFNDQFLVSADASRLPSAGAAPAAAGPAGARPRGSLMGVTPPERVAEAILRGIERNQREVYVTAKDRLFVLGANALPGLFEWAMIRLRRQRLARQIRT